MIKEYREAKQLSQEELAGQLGVAYASVNRWENGHFEPSNKIKKKIVELYLKTLNKNNMPDNIYDYSVKYCSINHRRYLGNKYKLLSFIREIVVENCPNSNSFADIFSGTGAVAFAFKDLKIITNDILYSNYIVNYAWFSPDSFDKEKLINIIKYYNSITVDEENYMTDNFSDTYFSREDCSKIGYIRQNIENRFLNKEISDRERAILITSLLYAMDRVANTCGHYDAYIKSTKYYKHIILEYPDVPDNTNANNKCFNEDANALVNRIEADIIYIDPPYNSRQYCDAYHLLENVAKWDKPEVRGVAKKMDRSNVKSQYCTRNATKVFEELINNIKAKYILLSYNNMGKKGNDRSNAKITDDDIKRILGTKGKVSIFSRNHKAFSAGKSNIEDNEERLFLCTCFGGNEK